MAFGCNQLVFEIASKIDDRFLIIFKKIIF